MRRLSASVALALLFASACAPAGVPAGPGAPPPGAVSVGTGRGSVTVSLDPAARRALLAGLSGIPFYAASDVVRIEVDVLKAEGNDFVRLAVPNSQPPEPVRFVATSPSQTFTLTDLGPGTYQLRAYAYPVAWSGKWSYGEYAGDWAPSVSDDQRRANCINDAEASAATFTIAESGQGQVRTLPLPFKPRPVVRTMASPTPLNANPVSTPPPTIGESHRLAFGTGNGLLAINNASSGTYLFRLKPDGTSETVPHPTGWNSYATDGFVVPGSGDKFLVLSRLSGQWQGTVADMAPASPGTPTAFSLSSGTVKVAAFFDGTAFQLLWTDAVGLKHASVSLAGAMGSTTTLAMSGALSDLVVSPRSATTADVVVLDAGTMNWASLNLSGSPALAAALAPMASSDDPQATALFSGVGELFLSRDSDASRPPLLIWSRTGSYTLGFLQPGSGDVLLRPTAGGDVIGSGETAVRTAFDAELGEHLITTLWSGGPPQLHLARVASYRHQAALSRLKGESGWAVTTAGAEVPIPVPTVSPFNAGFKGSDPCILMGQTVYRTPTALAPKPTPTPPSGYP